MRKRVFHISFRKRLLPLVLLWALGGKYAMGQAEITDSIVNKYVSVTKLYTAIDSDRDSVDVADASVFAVDDIVMLYQPKGFLLNVDEYPGEPTGAYGDVGQYALLVIDEIVGNTIIFNNATQFSPTKDYTVSQLIKVADYDSAVVKNRLTAPAWDSLTGTGGVVALFVRGRLQLEADIDVSGKGFKGAVPFPTDTYSGNCYPEEILERRHFLMNAHDTAGLKGEGAIYRNSLYIRGKGRVINGGGGGNGRYAGGGGGGNYLGGGDGAGQSDECVPASTATTAGEGGYGLQGSGLYDDGEPYPNRLFFGGGGGTGVSDFSGITSSPGGDGGGIVVIVADEIYSNGSGAIYADGASINEISDGAGGGGGAGGCIVLDANRFSGNVKLSAIGGRGGSTTSGIPVRGPGGGGAGGVYWLRIYESNIIDTVGMGPNGGFAVVGTDTTKALPGKLPAILSGSLEVPLRGFLFNTVPPNDSVCSNVIPPAIKASLPKGGVKPYSYQWIQSPDGVNWVDAVGVNDQKEYTFTSELSSTTYYRRIVQDAGVLTDTSVNFAYFVLPEITGNLIATDDVIACEGADPQTTISPAATLSGAYVDSDTTFQWQMWHTGGETPAPAGGEDTFRDYTLPTLYDTTFYRRVVQSGVCTSISDTVTIYVLDALGNNTIASKDTLCYGQSPELISGTIPDGGDLTNYWYAWEESFVEEGIYDNILFETRDLDYTDSVFTEDRYFRRIVYSGADSSCIDTTDILKIEVLDLISNNRMLFDGTTVLNLDTITICQYNQLPEGGLDGTIPQGGDGNYTYVWQVRDKTNPWGDSASYGPGTKFNLDAFGDTTYIRRMVLSGADDVCRDYSDSIVVGVVWEITNNILTATPETFCQGDELPTLTAEEPLGEAGLGRLWQYRTDTGDWLPAPGDSADQNYDFPDKLPETLYFRRYVWSEPSDSVCFSYTDSVKITVQDSILNNDILLINNDPLNESMVNSIIMDSICAGLDLHLVGTDAAQLTGGDETDYSYTWVESSEADFSTVTNTGNAFDYSAADFRDSAFFRRTVVSGVCADTTYLLVHPIVLPSGKMNLATLQADTVCASDELPVALGMEEMVLDPLTEAYTVYASYLSENHSGNNSFTLDRDVSGPIPFFVDTDSAETYVYHLDSIVDDRGCVSEILDPYEPSIMVYFSPEATIAATAEEVCGPAVELAATNQGGVSWRWLASTVKSDLDGTDTVTINATGLQADANLDFWFNDTAVIVYGFLLETSGSIGKVCADTAYTTVTHYQEPESPPYFIKNSVDDFGDSIAFDQVYFTDRYTLKVDKVSEPGKGEWTVAEGSPGTLGPDLNTPVMDVVLGEALDVDNIFVWTVSNGVCEAVTDRLIVRRKDVDVYEGISPNGDGLNDVLAMRGIKYADRISLQVFNSWGTKIFSMTEDEEMNYVSLMPNDPDSEELRVLWDGKVNGVVVPDGTYFYTVRFTINEGTPREKSYDRKKFLIISTQNSE